MNYARCVKFLLERSAPVLFDKVLGQELLTQLVFIREAARSTTDVCRVDVTRGLRLLWGLAVYFKVSLHDISSISFTYEWMRKISP